MSKSEYKSTEKNIAAEFRLAKKNCQPFADNAKDICMADAKGKQAVASAQLKANFKPSNKSNYNLSLAKAKAAYDVAFEKCDDMEGNAKGVCEQEAKAAFVSAKADATVILKTAKAQVTAVQESSEARSKAKETGKEARQEAASDKREANEVVAKEKCYSLSGSAKDTCMELADKPAVKK
ncbi:MAG: hypothetical protein WC742_13860 [Gallionellaceae bacterium]